MNIPQFTREDLMATPPHPVAAIAGKVLVNVVFLLLAIAAIGAYEHFKLHGQSTPSLVSLLAAGGFGLMPVRAILDELLAIESRVMHLLHGLGGLAVVGLVAGGSISGGSVLTHGALAPFAIMGAAQALMHAERPRTPEQAQALREFVASLPQVEQFASASSLSSPANVQHAMAVLGGLVAKAQLLGETELRSDPGFRAALSQATTRFGLSLGLDAIDHALGRLATNPAAAAALPGLRRQLAAARATVDGTRPGSAGTAHSGRAAKTTACARDTTGAAATACARGPATAGAAAE
jgi:hypothetical protein